VPLGQVTSSTTLVFIILSATLHGLDTETVASTLSKKFWEELIAYFLSQHTVHLVRHRPHREHRIQPFFYCCVCIRCRGNVFTQIHRHTNGKVVAATSRRVGRSIPDIVGFFN
jgi:hypothetical protein